MELHFGSLVRLSRTDSTDSREYRGEKGHAYAVNLTLAKFAAGAEDCGFCSILRQGIQLQGKFWILKWAANIQWINSRTDHNFVKVEEQQPWIENHWNYIQDEKSIDEEEMFLYIKFPKGHPYVHVHLHVAPPLFDPKSNSLLHSYDALNL